VGKKTAEKPGDDVYISAFNRSAEMIVEVARSSLSKVNRKKISEAVERICSAKRVFVYGVGRSGLVAKSFAMRLVQMGLEAYFIGETTTPIVEKGDVTVIVSNTGETMSAIQTANIVRRVGGEVVVFTGNRYSKLAHAANTVVEVPVPKNHRGENSAGKWEVVDKNLAPLGTLFEDTTMILLDALVAMMMKKLGETDESMRLRHAILV